jgi:hypothetical protein
MKRAALLFDEVLIDDGVTYLYEIGEAVSLQKL